MQSVTSGNSTVSYNYLTNGALSRLTSPSGTVYNFAYDTFGRTSSIAIGNRILSSTEYLNNHSSLVNKFTYGNGVYKNYTYDNLDRVLTESINGTQILSYLYDKRGNLVRVNDLQANVVTDFVFDFIGRPQGIKMSDGQRLHISYDNLNRVSLSKWSLNGISQLTEYIYGSNTVSGQKNGLIYGVKNNGNQVISYNYDELCRLASRTLNTTTPYITEYGYLEGSAPNTTTALIKTLKNGNDIYEYSYDDVGNITEVKLNNVVIESYTYDNLGQLTSATYNGDTYTYLYDNGGNITEVKKNETVIKAYTYGNTEWKDLLTAFNGTAITYDTIGNLLSYRDGYSFTWANGRQLASITKDNNALATYTYNADGLRTSKTVNGVTTNYYWINGILQGQKTGDEYIIFLYDESGTAYGMLVKNGTTESTYYYVRNLQGDIIGILDSNGVQVVSYTYGAWGDILSVGGSLASTIGQQNPLRYRGYYYDSETGFYYLQSRYYDTVTQRFVNGDSLLDNSHILGNNQFSYCYNNPVMFSDPSGTNPIIIVDIILEIILSIVATIVTVSVLPVIQKGLNDLGKTISASASAAIDKTKDFLGSFAADYMPSKAESKGKSHPKNTPYNYWAADLICKQIIVTTPLTADEAALRVSMGGNIMCRNENAARYILFVNGYINAVGPEKGIGEGFYPHFHPTRNHNGYDSIHIWFYE